MFELGPERAICMCRLARTTWNYRKHLCFIPNDRYKSFEHEPRTIDWHLICFNETILYERQVRYVVYTNRQFERFSMCIKSHIFESIRMEYICIYIKCLHRDWLVRWIMIMMFQSGSLQRWIFFFAKCKKNASSRHE